MCACGQFLQNAINAYRQVVYGSGSYRIVPLSKTSSHYIINYCMTFGWTVVRSRRSVFPFSIKSFSEYIMSWRWNRKELETIHFRKWMRHAWEKERERELDDFSIFYHHKKAWNAPPRYHCGLVGCYEVDLKPEKKIRFSVSLSKSLAAYSTSTFCRLSQHLNSNEISSDPFSNSAITSSMKKRKWKFSVSPQCIELVQCVA